MKNYNKSYACTDEQAINYLRENYMFDGKFSTGSPRRGFAPNNTIESGGCECNCGESACYRVFNEEMETVEVVVICEACYEQGTDAERVQ